MLTGQSRRGLDILICRKKTLLKNPSVTAHFKMLSQRQQLFRPAVERSGKVLYHLDITLPTNALRARIIPHIWPVVCIEKKETVTRHKSIFRIYTSTPATRAMVDAAFVTYELEDTKEQKTTACTERMRTLLHH
jgi:hypothetical protein